MIQQLRRQGLPDLEVWALRLYQDKSLKNIAFRVERYGWMEAEDFIQTFACEVLRCVKYYNPRKKSNFDKFCKCILRETLYSIKKKANSRIEIPMDFLEDFDIGVLDDGFIETYKVIQDLWSIVTYVVRKIYET